jgi:hypothetical protein
MPLPFQLKQVSVLRNPNSIPPLTPVFPILTACRQLSLIAWTAKPKENQGQTAAVDLMDDPRARLSQSHGSLRA